MHHIGDRNYKHNLISSTFSLTLEAEHTISCFPHFVMFSLSRITQFILVIDNKNALNGLLEASTG